MGYFQLGIRSTIIDLNPECFYNFDTQYSFIDEVTSTGYYIDFSENDFPLLAINNKGLLYAKPNVNVMTPALSNLENGFAYKSFFSGTRDPIQISDPHTVSNTTINNTGIVCEADLSEYKNNFPETGYSLFFQIKAATDDQYSTDPYCLIYDELMSASIRCGFLSTSNLLINYGRFLENINSVSYGFESSFYLNEPINNSIIKSNIGYGYESIAILDHDTQLIDLPRQWYGINAAERKNINDFKPKDNPYFKFGDLSMYVNYRNDDTSILVFEHKDNTFNIKTLSFVINKNDNNSIGINVLANNYNITLNGKSTSSLNVTLQSLKSLPLALRDSINDVKIGYKAEWKPLTKQPAIYENTNVVVKYPLFPRHSVYIDNFATFNKPLNSAEHTKLYTSNLTIDERFAFYGFTSLYNFESYYNKRFTVYIPNDTLITNKYSGSVLYYKGKSHGTVNYNEDDLYIKYSIVLKNGGMLYTKNRASYDYQNSGNYGLLTSSTGTIMFKFKTNDTNGVLYNNMNRQGTYGVQLRFDGYNLFCYINGIAVSAIGGYADNTWHTAFIIYGSKSTKIVIDGTVIASTTTNSIDTSNRTIFGASMSGEYQLDCELALIATSVNMIEPEIANLINDDLNFYYGSGIVTITNMPADAIVLIYDYSSGQLLDKINTNVDGTFTYKNYYPFTISVIVVDKTGQVGEARILSPIFVY